jgi:hypothetical protein
MRCFRFTAMAQGAPPPSELRGSSEHGVRVRRALRHRLQDIPVLDDLAVLQTEEVCPPRGNFWVCVGGLEETLGVGLLYGFLA